MLSNKYIIAIEENRDQLIKDLEVDDITVHLRKCKSFTRDDYEIIQSKVTTTEKVFHLLQILTEKDDDFFETFLEILGTESEHLANALAESINRPHQPTRRMSHTDFGEILIKGGVPERMGGYIRRKVNEKAIIDELKDGTNHPILIHGTLGCGKSSIVAHALYSEGLFPDRYSRVCWMSIGNIPENEIITRLIILATKLDSKAPDKNFQIPDLLKDIIKNKLQQHNILLVLDDIWNRNIMKYFTFPVTYIVTSRHLDLFPAGYAKLIEIPPRFSDSECREFLSYDTGDGLSPDLMNTIIRISHSNPLYITLIKNLVKSNRDTSRIIAKLDMKDLDIDGIIESNLVMLSNDERKCYNMLCVLREDSKVSLNFLFIVWNVDEAVALKYATSFCNSHLLSKEWSEEYKCNMYGMHDIYSLYLHNKDQDQQQIFRRQFIDTHLRKFPNWLKFNYCDPYFFMHCASALKSLDDQKTLLSLFTDFTFIAAKIVVAGILDLLFDYETYPVLSDLELWNQFKSFFMRHSHKFVKVPFTDVSIAIKKVFATIIQLALFENQASKVFTAAQSCMDQSFRNDFWLWDNPVPSIKTWEASHDYKIDLMDINHIGILLTSDCGWLSLFEVQNGKCLFNYKISDEKIVFCKFLRDDKLEFVLLSVTGLIRHFDVSKMLDQVSSQISVEGYNDDDQDFLDIEPQGQRHDIDFNDLRQRFRYLLVHDFVPKCEILPAKCLNDKQSFLTGCLAGDSLITASHDSSLSPTSESPPQTIISSFEITTWFLNRDFIVDNGVKKMISTKKKNSFFIFILVENGAHIIRFNEFGEEMESFRINNGVITDFIVVADDLYFSVGNSIYKNQEEVALFSTISNANINQISMCSKQRVMALCLTNRSIQIWDINKKQKLYAMKGFDFSDVLFECCNNHLVTTEKSNVAKWSMDSVYQGDITQSLHRNFRSKFFMHTHNQSILWVIQKYNNEIELLSCCNEDYRSCVIQMESKLTCCVFEDDYAFLGFYNSHLRIYNMSDWSHVLTINSVNNIKELAAFSTDDHWNIIVYYDSGSIKILSISKLDYSCVSESATTKLEDLSKLKMFKMSTENLVGTVSLNKCCTIYRIGEGHSLEVFYKQSLLKEQTIIDFDVSEQKEYMCVVTTKGLLKIWCIDRELAWSDKIEPRNTIRLCKFRPKVNKACNVVATVADDGVVRLYYFYEEDNKLVVNLNVIIEDSPQDGLEMFATITWTTEGKYLIFGDVDIRKWRVPESAVNRTECKLPLTKLYTCAGGISCITTTECFICTVDKSGAFYILRKI